jgi:ribonuclease P protein component
LFEEVMKKGRVIHSPLFVVRILREASIAGTHVSAVAPVKIAKTSVARHRMRRRIYEAVRAHVPNLVPGNVVVFLAKQSAIDVSLSDMRQAVSDIFVKAGLLR